MDCIGYHEETCYKCGVVFQMTTKVYKQRLEDGEVFFCPNGHGQIYARRKNSEERLKAKVSRLEVELGHLRSRIGCLNRNLDYERKSRAAYQGHYNRAKREMASA